MQSTSQLFGGSFQYACDLVVIELRNMEALQLAQHKMLQSMGLLAQRQAEITGAIFKRAFGTPAATAPSAPGIAEAMIAQVASLKAALLEGQANSNLLAELAARGSGEVASILQSRMFAALDEFTAALQQAVPPPAPAAAVAPLALSASAAVPATVPASGPA